MRKLNDIQDTKVLLTNDESNNVKFHDLLTKNNTYHAK
jgi:hypothetical protein